MAAISSLTTRSGGGAFLRSSRSIIRCRWSNCVRIAPLARRELERRLRCRRGLSTRHVPTGQYARCLATQLLMRPARARREADHALGHAGREQDRRRRVAQVVEAQALCLASAVCNVGSALASKR